MLNQLIRRIWREQRGSQALQAAGAALAGAILVLALFGGVERLGPQIERAFQCAAASLTGSGSCPAASPAPAQDDPPWWQRWWEDLQVWARQFNPPTGCEMLTNQTVRDALEAAWQRSDVGSYERRHEEGGWIIWNRRTGEYRVVNVPPGERAALTTIGAPPATAQDEQVVAFFHTHPNPSPTDERGQGWEQGPSEADVRFAEHYNLPGLLRNYNGQSAFGPNAGNC